MTPCSCKQAVLNLLDNAIEFSPQGGSIEISLSIAEGQAQITFRDHGPGAPATPPPQLFERFYSPAPPGHWQEEHRPGLALVREVARLHGEGVPPITPKAAVWQRFACRSPDRRGTAGSPHRTGRRRLQAPLSRLSRPPMVPSAGRAPLGVSRSTICGRNWAN
ncbi:MAG: hypothetical protein IPM73_03060 [Betaproteobacteria bacterium]|nr:hypothetical protein [Betaproteobacteria bacterium]